MSIDRKTVAYFNHMHQALKTIGKQYQTPDKLRKSCGTFTGLAYEEALEMAYENMQETAKGAIQGIRPIMNKPSDSKWIKFEIATPKKAPKVPPKTHKYWVINKASGYVLGMVKWYGSFRQYSFFPSENCVFEKTCMQDITDFLEQLMEERKKAK